MQVDKAYHCPIHGTRLTVSYCDGYILFGPRYRWQAQCSDCEKDDPISPTGTGATITEAQLSFLEQVLNEERLDDKLEEQ